MVFRATCLFILAAGAGFAQTETVAQLKSALALATTDTARINRLNDLAFILADNDFKEAERFAAQALEESDRGGYVNGKARALVNMAMAVSRFDLSAQALEHYLDAARLSESAKAWRLLAYIYYNLGGLYFNSQDYEQALHYSKKSLALNQRINDSLGITRNFMGHGLYYRMLNNLDSAFYFTAVAVKNFERGGTPIDQASALTDLAAIYFAKGNKDQAMALYAEALAQSREHNFLLQQVYILNETGSRYTDDGKFSDAHAALAEALQITRTLDHPRSELQVLANLATLFDQWHRTDSAYHYTKLTLAKERLFSSRNKRDQLQALQSQFRMKQRLQELELSKQQLERQRIISFALIGLISAMALAGFLLVRSYRQKKVLLENLKELNRELQERSEEITTQAEELKEANEEIRRINENLEAMVSERTLRVKEQTDRILSYAHLNAHKVRGPLARILGLVNVLQMPKQIDDDLNDWLERIKQSASELDSVVREMNDQLHPRKP